jgi:hypothetical protein
MSREDHIWRQFKEQVKGIGKIAISNDHSLSNVLYAASEFQSTIHWVTFVILAINVHSLQMK